MKNFLLFVAGFISNLASVKGHRVAEAIVSNAVDTVIVPASIRYSSASMLRRMATGTNYRKEWETPVKMPVFDISRSGLRIEKMGGGQQTRSLHLVDGQGNEWVLRTVDKFVEGALPPLLRNTIAEDIVQDMVSASHPYAALIVSPLAEALRINAPEPVLYFVPDDANLGEARADFANRVCFLEQREPTYNSSDTKNTAEIVEEKIHEPNHLILQKQVLKARLLDMLVGDWDRHPDQWRWGMVDSLQNTYYYPIPRDRDQAFFMSGGLIPAFVRLFVMQHINRFNYKSSDLKKLNFKSWNFDRFFLNELNGDEWLNTIKEVRRQLGDEIIDAAVKKIPPEVYPISGPEIASRLKSRRDHLEDEAMKYYRFLAREVSVKGTSRGEMFRVTGSGDELNVLVFEMEAKGLPGKKIFERRFRLEETRQLVLDGLDGDDLFIVDNSADAGIKLKIFGDKGKDIYNIDGDTPSYVYDARSDGNLFYNKGSARVKFEERTF